MSQVWTDRDSVLGSVGKNAHFIWNNDCNLISKGSALLRRRAGKKMVVLASPWHVPKEGFLAHLDVPVGKDRALPVSAECCDSSSPERELGPFLSEMALGWFSRGKILLQKQGAAMEVGVSAHSLILLSNVSRRCTSSKSTGSSCPYYKLAVNWKSWISKIRIKPSQH